jgi:tRNA(adenine34) deaminase
MTENLNVENDIFWMKRALELASEAEKLGEVPVGALVVCNGKVVAEAYNRKESDNDPLGHAEIYALQAAAKSLGRWRLSDCTLYVTLEPCVMCAGAIVHSRIDRVVYGAADPKAGAVHSVMNVLTNANLNHSPRVLPGVCEELASAQLKAFFKKLRDKKEE